MRRDYQAPSGIRIVNWLQSDGSAVSGSGPFIQTDIDTYMLETYVIFQEVTRGESTGKEQLVCGCWNDNNNRYYPAQHSDVRYRDGIYTSSRDNTITKIADYDLYDVHTVIYNDYDNKVWCDGVYKCTVSDITTENLPYKVGLFGYILNPSAWRIYYARFTRKDINITLGEFYPAVDANGVPCMCNILTQQCFYNQGTGQFTYG